MEYKCAVCGDAVHGGLDAFVKHTDEHIIELVKERHPEWVEEDGMCQKCYEYYRNEIEGKSSP